MNTMTTILGFDIKGVSNPILMTSILFETPSDRKEMTVPIDMDYMGIDEDTDFDMELSKDFIREVEKFHRDRQTCLKTITLQENVVSPNG